MLLLALLFLVTAALYASVGFAGGSTYNALLVLWGVDFRILPTVALLCNLIVATGGSIRFARAGLIPWQRLWPILLVSMPAAWIGGAIPVSKSLFVLLLGGSLLAAGILLIVQPERTADDVGTRRFALGGPILGGVVGLLSGIVGIGGGIFLAPILHLIGWDAAKRIAATASVFILANSLAGLGGQLTKLSGDPSILAAAADYGPLALAVLVGGQLGSHVGIRVLPAAWVRRVTALLILYVSVRLLFFT